MKIIIDATQIPVLKAGVGVYVTSLIKALGAIDSCHQFHVIVQDDQDLGTLLKLSNRQIKFIRVRSSIFRILLLRICFEQFLLPIYAKSIKADILHSVHYSFPLFLPRIKRIVTMHDVGFFIFPRCYPKLKLLYFRFFIKIARFFVDDVITISKSSKKDLSRFSGINQDNIHVAELGIDRWSVTEKDNPIIKRLMKAYNIYKPYLLYLGTIEPRKNIQLLLNAFRRTNYLERKYILILAGQKGWMVRELIEDIRTEEKKGNVIWIGYVHDLIKPFLIRGAELFLYPSLYEGFGIPVLEAMSMQVPTITSLAPAMDEIAGDAALLIPPDDEIAMANAIKKVVSDESLNRSLIQKGKSRAKLYTWHNTAKKIIEIYELTFNQKF
jgi:glycosyltransferase involved in cell wall biosynthesis